MENKVKKYKETFEKKQTELTSSLENLRNLVENFKKENNEKITRLKEKAVKPEIVSKVVKSEKSEQKVKELEKLNKKLETKLKRNSSVLDELKLESKQMLDELNSIIKGLNKTEDEECRN